MRRYYKSVKYTVIGGYVILTALLFVSLWLVLNKMSQLSALDDTEMELYEKRLRANEAFTSLYKVEMMGQTIDFANPLIIWLIPRLLMMHSQQSTP